VADTLVWVRFWPASTEEATAQARRGRFPTLAAARHPTLDAAHTGDHSERRRRPAKLVDSRGADPGLRRATERVEHKKEPA